MRKPTNTYMQEIVKIINQLTVNHPKISLGKHIDTALDGENIWSLSNEKFYSLLRNYKILKDGMDLSLEDHDELY